MTFPVPNNPQETQKCLAQKNQTHPKWAVSPTVSTAWSFLSLFLPFSTTIRPHNPNKNPVVNLLELPIPNTDPSIDLWPFPLLLTILDSQHRSSQPLIFDLALPSLSAYHTWRLQQGAVVAASAVLSSAASLVVVSLLLLPISLLLPSTLLAAAASAAAVVAATAAAERVHWSRDFSAHSHSSSLEVLQSSDWPVCIR